MNGNSSRNSQSAASLGMLLVLGAMSAPSVQGQVSTGWTAPGAQRLPTEGPLLGIESFQPSSDGLLTTGGPSVTPNDRLFNSQWNLKKIGAPQVWSVTTGSTNIVVAVLDIGVDYRHEDLAPNMWRNPGETGLDANGHDKATNGIDDDGDGYIDDLYGIDTYNHSGNPLDPGYDFGGGLQYHGSNCAGVIGAAGNNGKGIAGINWEVQIMAIGIRDGTEAEFLEAYDYVLAMKGRGVDIRVISDSWSAPRSPATTAAVDRAGEAGILSVFAAGNDGVNNDLLTGNPISQFAMSVAMSTTSDGLDSATRYGRSTVHLAAPTSVPTTGKASVYDPAFWGTSASCPHVSGAIALLAAAHPEATPLELKASILQGVDQSAAFSKTISGGRLNVARALQVLTNTSLPPIVVGAIPAGSISPTASPIEVVFSRPMDTASVEVAFQITPAIEGHFEWTNENRTLRFTHPMLTPSLVTTNSYACRILGTARDASGRTLDGNFNQKLDGSPADDFVWNFALPIANDYFADAQVIAGPQGSISGTTRGTDVPEADEPLAMITPNLWWGLSVWYRWTPERSGWATFDLTLSNQFDTVMAVFTGSELAHLTQVAVNDNYGTLRGSRLSFPALGGTNYFIKVAGKYQGTVTSSMWGDFLLRWYETPPPVLGGEQFTPAAGAVGTTVNLSGTNFTGATAVLFNGASAVFTNVSGNNVDLKIVATVPAGAGSGPITVKTPHGEVTSGETFEVIDPSMRLAAHELSHGQIQITWPTAPAGWQLEVTSLLGPGAHWTTVPSPGVQSADHIELNVDSSMPKQYFRLRRQ